VRRAIDLGAIERGTRERPSHDGCPGALLVVNRDEYDELVKGGETFVTARSELSPDERRDARVLCSAPLLRKEGVGGMVYFGLCASCSDAERRMRELARLRAEGSRR